jgi:hypothetical protein
MKNCVVSVGELAIFRNLMAIYRHEIFYLEINSLYLSNRK